MSDNYNASIRIGPIPRPLIQEFLEMIDREGVSRDWSSGACPSSEEELIQTASGRPDGVLELTSHDALNGMFEQLEEWLASHGISFRRHSDAYYEYDAEVVIFHAGMESAWSFASDQADDGDLLVSAGTIKRLVNEYKRSAEADPVGAGQRLCYSLLEQAGETLQPMPPFAILEEPANPSPETQEAQA